MRYDIITIGRRNRISEVDYNASDLDIAFRIANPGVKRQTDYSIQTNFLMTTKQVGNEAVAERYSLSQKTLPEIKIDFENEHGFNELGKFAVDLVIRCAEILYLVEHNVIGETYFHPANLYGENVNDLRIALRKQPVEGSIKLDDAITSIKNLWLWALTATPVLDKINDQYDNAVSGLSNGNSALATEGEENLALVPDVSAIFDVYFNPFYIGVDNDTNLPKPINSAEDIFHIFGAERQLDEIRQYVGNDDKYIEPLEQNEPIVDEVPVQEEQEPIPEKPKPKHEKPKKHEKSGRKMPKWLWILLLILIALIGWFAWHSMSSNNSQQNQVSSSSSSVQKIDMDKLKNDMAQGQYSKAANLAEEVNDISNYNQSDQQTIMTALLTDYRYDKAISLSSDKDSAASQIFLQLSTDRQKTAFKNMNTSDSVIDGLKKAVDKDTSGLNAIPASTKISETTAKACAQAYANSNDNDGAKQFVTNHPGAKSYFKKAYEAQNKGDIANGF